MSNFLLETLFEYLTVVHNIWANRSGGFAWQAFLYTVRKHYLRSEWYPNHGKRETDKANEQI